MSSLEQTRTEEACEALEKVLCDYSDVFGPKEDNPEQAMLEAWMIVQQYRDMETAETWTVGHNSAACSYPLRVGLLQIALNAELSE